MSLLLDTNVLLRLTVDSADITDSFKEEVESGLVDGGVAVSAVTFVETTRLHHHGQIDLGCHPAVWRRERLLGSFNGGRRRGPGCRGCFNGGRRAHAGD